MKRLLIGMLGAMIAFTSCQKNDLDGTGDGGMVDVTLSASMSATSATTRSESGDGTTVDRCILEVYTSDGSLYTRMMTSVDATKASFDLRLVSSQTYDFLLWADKSGDGEYADGHYTIDTTDEGMGLKGITTSYDSYVGNDETRDAFYCAKTGVNITASTVISAELTRPFGQVNVKTYLEDVPSTMHPKYVQIEYTTTVGNTFDVSSGEISGEDTAIEWDEVTDVIYDGSTDETKPYIDLSTDYLFASEDQQDLHKFTMYFYDSNSDLITSNENFTNIPVQRNYKTNISGELLTKQGTINVTISSDFIDPDNDMTIEEVATITAANVVIAEASDDVNIKIVETVSGSSDNVIVLPDEVATSNVNSVTIDFSTLATGTAITIGDSDEEKYDGTISIIVSSEEQAETITVNAENAHVTFYGTAGEVIALTNETTFVVEAGASIGTLTVNGGNVEIYGEVDAVTMADNTTSIVKVWTVYDEAQFDAALALGSQIEKIVLADNITLNESVTLDNDLEIDGGGYTLTASDSQTQLSCNANLSLNDITISNTKNGYAIYITESSTATEFNINNSTLSGYAAIYVKGDEATFNIKNSILTGTNTSSSLEMFATICTDSDATGNTFNIEGSTINTVTTSSGYQYAIDIRENTGSTTVNLLNGTNFYYKSNGNSSQGRYYLIEHEVNNDLRSKFTRDATITWASDMTKDLSLASGLLFGNGTEESPYEIYDNYDLKVLQYYTNYDAYDTDGCIFAYFKQMANIEYSLISTTYTSVYPSPMTTFTPSSSTTSVTTSQMLVQNFYGVYDGNGYAINNWGYNSTATGVNWGTDQNIGLFAYVYHGSTIKDLTLTCDAGSDGILVTEDCQIKDLAGVGAFAGNLGGTIENCVNYIPIDVYSSESTCKVGGILGRLIYGDDGTYLSTTVVNNCTNNSSVTLTGDGSAAGILGGGYSAYWCTVAEISDCTMNGNVTAPAAYGIYVDPAYSSTFGRYDYYIDLDEDNVCTGTVTSTAE